MSEMKCPICKEVWNNMSWATNPNCYTQITCSACKNKWVLVK